LPARANIIKSRYLIVDGEMRLAKDVKGAMLGSGEPASKFTA